MTENEIDAVKVLASDAAYIVHYDENLFRSYSKEDQDYCFEVWTRKAAMMRCRFVSVRLIPDELFPTHGHDEPYIFRTDAVPPPPSVMFEVDTFCNVKLNTALWQGASEADKGEMRDKAAEAGRKSGCKVWYVRLGNATLDSGKGNL